MKIAIVTHYYKSDNYGGNLQAYALCYWLKKNGYDAEQLCFNILPGKIGSTYYQRLKKQVCYTFKVFSYNILCKNREERIKSRKVKKYYKLRKNSMLKFNLDAIPHSSKVYFEKTIKTSVKNYDCFISGSDMVWFPEWYSPILTLEFVPDNIPKFSYAPSVGVTKLSETQKKFYKEFLSSYQDVSVREESSVGLLKDLVPDQVHYVLDPTLLLSRSDWDKICNKKIFSEKYLFCYFLGDYSPSRKIAEEYAKKYNLKLVTIPYLIGKYQLCDDGFGDVQFSEVSPSDFISLIKYADVVFTDSFHACVFSFIYNKQFITFRRDTNNNFSSRICNFLSMTDLADRFCDSIEKECMGYIENINNIDYSDKFECLKILKEQSENYLIRNLKTANERINMKNS